MKTLIASVLIASAVFSGTASANMDKMLTRQAHALHQLATANGVYVPPVDVGSDLRTQNDAYRAALAHAGVDFKTEIVQRTQSGLIVARWDLSEHPREIRRN